MKFKVKIHTKVQKLNCCCCVEVKHRHGSWTSTLYRRLNPFHLDAHSSRRLAQRQDRVVLGSVQPVDSQFGAGGPFHHGDIILPPENTRSEWTTLVEFFVACYWIRTASDWKGHHSPYPWVIRFLHHYRVQGTVEAHHWQVHDRVLLPSLQRPTGNSRLRTPISGHRSNLTMTLRGLSCLSRQNEKK